MGHRVLHGIGGHEDYPVSRATDGSEQPDSEAFWLDKLSDRPDCRLPRWPVGWGSQLVDERLPPKWRWHNENDGHGAAQTLLPQELCERLATLAGRCGVPLRSVVLAAHLRVLSLVTGSADVLTGLTVSGRADDEDAAGARGYFLNI